MNASSSPHVNVSKIREILEKRSKSGQKTIVPPKVMFKKPSSRKRVVFQDLEM